jgi:hypothetical protein
LFVHVFASLLIPYSSILYPLSIHYLSMIYPLCVPYYIIISILYPLFIHYLSIIYPWFIHDLNLFNYPPSKKSRGKTWWRDSWNARRWVDLMPRALWPTTSSSRSGQVDVQHLIFT